MTTPTSPDDPEGTAPGGREPPYGQVPYGLPPGGGPASGTPPPGYGQPASFGQYSPYGQPYGYGGSPQLADWGLRVGAYLIDWGIPAVICIVGVLIGTAVSNTSRGLGALFTVTGVLGGLAFALWNLVRQGNTGQTIGKTGLNLRLVREADGRYVGAGMSILRQIAHVVDNLACYIGWLWPLWDVKRQTFADKIMSTLVIRG